jgi:molybdenum cofactor sulfurtransferase
LLDEIYLDHAGTTLYSKSLMERFSSDMILTLYGNPHSASLSSQTSTTRIENIRLRALESFRADPAEFDLVFVANATAGIKLVMDAFQCLPDGFIYGYHKDSHTSLVGVRETAIASRCLSDNDVENWLHDEAPLTSAAGINSQKGLFAYPAQSNMDGRRLPLSWPKRVRKTHFGHEPQIYTLLDAAAFVSTAQLDLSDESSAPDFVVISFNKIFGFPDLGALIVRKASGKILQSRKYFGGGTVETVVCIKEQWHSLKDDVLHESLEDGTLPLHSIMALGAAMCVHKELYESMDKISKHTSFLAEKLFLGLRSLTHPNGKYLCHLYSNRKGFSVGSQSQGPVVAFNLKNSHGAWISNAEVEKLASVRQIHIRIGGLCNPGGIATALNLSPWEIKRNFCAGFRCGNENDIIAGKPTGVLRASIGAMSTVSDIERFVNFLKEFYVEKTISCPVIPRATENDYGLYVESLTIYPIKSCGGLSIPSNVDWEVRPEGLAWDREWCLVHQGTGHALSQKLYPRMAMIRPWIDFEAGLLEIKYQEQSISIPLSGNPNLYDDVEGLRSLSSRVCGDAIIANTYSSKVVKDFFTNILDVPCALARFPAGGSGASTRHSKAHMQNHQRTHKVTSDVEAMPGAFPSPITPPDSDNETTLRPILLSNESPILLVNTASLHDLNTKIVRSGGKPANASVFRANIVLASSTPLDQQNPYSEDLWERLQIGQQEFKMLGSCRRCHMICVDQETAEKNEEPFVTLAKTRKFEGKIFFGSHMCHIPAKSSTRASQYPTIRIGDMVATNMNEL